MTEGDALTVRSVSPARDAEWSAFVESHPAATVFHTAGWASAVETAFGYDPAHRWLADRSGAVRAVIPGFAVGEGLGSSVLNPFCEYGFPLVDEDISDAAVLSALDDGRTRIVKDAGWSGVSGYRSTGYGGVPTGSAIRLALDRPFETLRESAFDRDVRRCVRTARDHGVTVRDGTVEEFYPLYLATMRRLGSPQFPERFFTALADELGTGVTIRLAERAGETIAGVLLFEHGETTMVWTPVSRRAHWEHRPNHLLYAEAIERACAAGRSTVDFGRSRRESSVHGFKAQFGGVEYPLMSFVTPPHHASRASLDGYGRLAPLTQRLAPLITHPTIGPKLKRAIHE
ncbi:lipid II:glycine glycyltransferase FemX [Halococcus sediminicola]|uniref:lipid II:glycine glycyltransferase FemX n=1 Tax=Halococcus sediminicola TaxID=1264579 RepID=UPI00067913EB|nr:GNAT family N-acetyltransferase [Halococcus sediminicola]